MRRLNRSAWSAIVLTVTLSPGSARAQSVASSFPGAAQVVAQPGSWEHVDALPPGKPITVSLKAGEQLNGFFNGSDSGTLVVIDRRGGERSISKSEVEKITSTDKIRDSLGNGAKVGAAIGLAVALGVLAAVAVSSEGGSYVLPSAKIFAPLMGIGAGVGLGVVIDAGHQGTKIWYRALSR